MSSTPASTAGRLATIPTGLPASRAKPVMMLSAKPLWTSRKAPSSAMRRMTSSMSYGLLALSGTTSSSASSARLDGSRVTRTGGSSTLLLGRYASSSRTAMMQAGSLSNVKWEMPDVPPWMSAPPSCSKLTSSCVTVFTTLGPVTNMYETPRTMNTKSVIAGL